MMAGNVGIHVGRTVALLVFWVAVAVLFLRAPSTNSIMGFVGVSLMLVVFAGFGRPSFRVWYRPGNASDK
jgi:hypothetical protein